MLTLVSVIAALLAGACLAVASPQQGGRAAWHLAWLALLPGAVALAAQEYGFWAGAFIALAAFMLGMVLLPYLNAYRRMRHVG
ncbi:hypothetical protein GTP41_23210 [Pseudoduganella sp. DS3]|uniref:DUF2484 family protein n=1 Tax=Pseudoduganella guangdongensis TaxID=2692179 RepID=A0A6N9HNL8_9BURK|nr:hypothetical protein [Pseudoduganella guangdongensis]MYN05009.1 hypothetical protein [Pseudoduganella guangdongensis]